MNRTRWLLLFLTWAAFGLRVWQLDGVPPGWRDDELSNAFVISQKVLDGDWRVFYADASGHEGLYHWLVAGMRAVVGDGAWGVRGVSAYFGTLAVPLTYAIGRHLVSRHVGLIAAAGVTVSFWALMYARIGLRHVSMPVFMLLAFVWLWRGLRRTDGAGPVSLRPFVLAGTAAGVGLYTYFAARGVPLIMAAFAVALLLFAPRLWRATWRGWLALFAVCAAVALPLVITLQRQPAGTYRVAEVAKPLTAAAEGDYSIILEHVVRTFNMFHSDGDDEYLYNIPFRPVFNVPVAAIFWFGVAVALWYVGRVLLARRRAGLDELGYVFLFGWWLAGIAPAFISVPPGSLGHNIAAQPATYVLLGVGVARLGEVVGRLTAGRGRTLATGLLAGLCLVGIGARDLPDYFVDWPVLAQTRFLYRAEIRAVAREAAEADYAVSGLLAGPWDRLAHSLDAPAARARWYEPQRALFMALGGEPAVVYYGYPAVAAQFGDLIADDPGGGAGAYRRGVVAEPEAAADDARLPVCWDNGLCLAEYAAAADGAVTLTFVVAAPLDLPQQPLVSFPPPPGVYAGPRLRVFVHLLDENGALIAGDDGLWVDSVALWPGDRFVQRHELTLAEGEAIAIGLYDPLTGDRRQIPGLGDRLVIAFDEAP